MPLRSSPHRTMLGPLLEVSMPRSIKLFLSSTLFALSLPLACGGENDNLPPPPPPPPPPPMTASPVASAPPDAAPPAPPPPAVTLLPGAASPDPTPPPTVKITAPSKGQTILADKAKDFV